MGASEQGPKMNLLLFMFILSFLDKIAITEQPDLFIVGLHVT